MASGELSLTSNSSQDDSREFSCYTNDHQLSRTACSSNDNPKDFDSMKQQYDAAMIELNSLRVQNSDIQRRVDRLMSEFEFYRNHYETAREEVNRLREDSNNLRIKYEDVTNENEHLIAHNIHLDRKLTSLIDSMKHQELNNGNSQTVCALVEQHNELKKKYDNSLLECEKLIKDVEACNQSRNSVAMERERLQKLLTNACAKIDTVYLENNILREDRDKLLQQNDDNIKNKTRLLQQCTEELRLMSAQRHAVDRELSTILSERKAVLEENQKLCDDLSMAREELENYYKDDKKIKIENENLKCELESVLR